MIRVRQLQKRRALQFLTEHTTGEVRPNIEVFRGCLQCPFGTCRGHRIRPDVRGINFRLDP